MTAFFSEYRPLFLIATFGLLGAAFYLTYRPRKTARGRNSRVMVLNKLMLWGVTGIAVVLLFFPEAMTDLFAVDASSEGKSSPEVKSKIEVSSEMQQTVIAIEGMT